MRFQSTQASCGPASLRTALLARGITRSEDELIRLSGCSNQGTTPRGLMRAALLVAKDSPGLIPGVLSERRDDVALLRLLAAHRAGSVGILLVDNGEHWVVSFGILGEADPIFHVADSDDQELVLHYRAAKLADRWRSDYAKPFYAIIL